MLKNKKYVVLLLCLVILAQATTVFAVSFPDVTKDGNSGWAYDYIMELANKGIIKGYDDGTYKPENNVTYLETLSLLHGVMSPTRAEINEAVSKHKEFLNTNGTPEWAIEIAAVALSRGVVKETEYKRAADLKMIEIGTKLSISRYDVAVFTARALELEPKSATSLTYKDKDSINSSGAPLIAALIDTKVLHKDGRDGEFLPNAPIRRSEMAKMIKYAYDWTLTHPLKGSAAKTETVKGTVVSYHLIGEKNFLVYKPSNAKDNTSVILTSNTKVTDKDNKTVALKDIANYEGAEVTITYKMTGTDKEATEVKFTTDKLAVDGEYTFKSYRESGNKYYITVTDKAGTSREYESKYKTAKNGKSNISIQDIKENAKVNVKFTSGVASDVSLVTEQTGDYEVTSTSTTYTGVKYIDVKKVSGSTTDSFTVDNKTVFERDGKAAKYEDIGRGSILDISSKSNKVADRVVIYTGAVGDNYTFVKFDYGRMYIKNERTGITEDYYLSKNVKWYDGITESNIRNGQAISVKFSNNEITEISGSSVTASDNYTFVKFNYGRMYIKNERTGKTEDYYLSRNIKWYDGITESNIRNGQAISVKFSNNEIAEIAAASAYQGSGDYTFSHYNGGRIVVTNNRTGYREEYFVPTSISSQWTLNPGDQIYIRTSGDEVIDMYKISSSSDSSYRVDFIYSSGNFEYYDSSNKKKVVKLDKTSNIGIYLNDKKIGRDGLPYAGYAKLTYDRYGDVIYIDVDRITDYSGEYDGVIEEVFNNNVWVDITANGLERKYEKSSGEKFYRGDKVTVKLNRDGEIRSLTKR